MRADNDNLSPAVGADARCAATVIDMVTVLPLSLSFAAPVLDVFDGADFHPFITITACLFAWILVTMVALAAFEGLLGATPGKFVCGLRVRMMSGSRCGFQIALRRNFGKYTFLPLSLFVLFRSNWASDGALHDRICGSIVTTRAGVSA